MIIKELTRLNEIARIARSRALTTAEDNERAELRRAYLAAIRGNINTMLVTATVIDPEGRDVTPGKLRAAQVYRPDTWVTGVRGHR